MFKVQLLLKGNRAKWVFCDDLSGEKPVPRVFNSEAEAIEFGKRFPEKTRVVPA